MNPAQHHHDVLHTDDNPRRSLSAAAKPKTKENPMKTILSGLLTGSLLLSTAMAGEAGPATGGVTKDVPLGHKDFYPSPQRPVGFRGDGNGCFPGATPVSEFWDGTPAEVERPLITESFGKPIDTKGKTTAKVWDVTDEKSKNIVWKTRLPGWSLADPIVVGDRVFAVGEPDFLTCFDAVTGKVLWQHRVLPLELDGKSPEEATRVQEVIDVATAFAIRWLTDYAHMFLAMPAKDSAPLLEKLVERLPAWRKIVEDADNDPGLLAAFDKAAVAVAGCAKVEGAALKQTKAQIGEFIEAVQKRYRVMVIPQWYGHVGHANATPCSDGTLVYVAFGRGQVAAYDLDGRRVWGRRFDKWSRDLFGGLNLSPQLCDDVLIVKDLSNVTWHGLDAKTGKTLWSRPEIKHEQYYYMTALMVTLTAPDGKPKRVVIYPKDMSIRRATDDAVLGHLPLVAGKEGDGGSIHHLLAQGDLVWRGLNEGAGFRLRLVADDRVEVTPVWENKTMRSKRPFHTGALGIIVGQSSNGAVNLYSFATGESVAQIKVGRGEDLPSSSYVIGNLLFGVSEANSGNNHWWRGPMSYGGGQGGEGRPTDRKAMVRFKLINLADPKAPKTISERNLLQEPGPAADIHVERFFAGLDPFLFAGTYHGSASFFGCVMGGPVASGNRIFIQSATHLRCIGDPAVQYDWNPQSRPETITNALKTKTPSTKEP